MKYDVLIAGGGISGCACAYIASKLGLKTAILDKNNYLGGLITGGLVVPCMKTDTQNINTDFFNTLIEETKKFNAQIEYEDKNKGWFNPHILKVVLESMLDNAGVDIYYESNIINAISNGYDVEKIEIDTNILSLYIEAKYFVDSTGDAKIFRLLNEDFANEKNEKQAQTLRFIMSGVDMETFRNFLLKTDNDRNVTTSCIVNNEIHLSTAYTWDKNRSWNLSPLFDKALEDKVLKPFDTAYFQIFTIPSAKGSVAFNCPRLKDHDIFSPLEHSKALIEARKSIIRLSNFAKKYLKGFENAYISDIADMTGARETNNIISKNNVKKEDLISGKMPKFPVLSGDYPIDIHSNKKDNSTLKEIGKYYIDISALQSANYNNLYAAGRNLGADRYAQAALRTQLSCMSMGEAVAKHIYSCINNC